MDKVAFSTTVVPYPSPSRYEWTTSCRLFATPRILGDPILVVTSTFSMLIMVPIVFGFLTFTPSSQHASNCCMKLSTLAFNLSIPSRTWETWPLISGNFLSMVVIREDKLGDFDAYPINPSKDPYKSNISIPLMNYY